MTALLNAFRSITLTIIMVALIALGSTTGLLLSTAGSLVGGLGNILTNSSTEMANDLIGTSTITTFRAITRRK